MSGVLLKGDRGRVGLASWAVGLKGLKGIREALKLSTCPWGETYFGGNVVTLVVPEGIKAGKYLYWPDERTNTWPDLETLTKLIEASDEPDLIQWMKCQEHGGFWTYDGCPTCKRNHKAAEGIPSIRLADYKLTCRVHLLIFRVAEGCGLCRVERDEEDYA